MGDVDGSSNRDGDSLDGKQAEEEAVEAVAVAATRARKVHKVPLFKRMLERAIEEDMRFQKEKNDSHALSKMKRESQSLTADDMRNHMREHDRIIRQKRQATEEAMLLRRLKTMPPRYVNETISKLMASMKPNEFQASGNREKFLKSFNLKVAKMAVENLDLTDSKNSKYNYKSGDRNVDNYVKATGLSPVHAAKRKVLLHKERDEAASLDWEKRNRLKRARDYAMKVRDELTLLAPPPLASAKAAARSDDAAARLRSLLDRRGGALAEGRGGYGDCGHDYDAEYDNRHIRRGYAASSSRSSHRDRDRYESDERRDDYTPRKLATGTPKRVRFAEDTASRSGIRGDDSTSKPLGSSAQSRQHERDERALRLREFERVFDRERHSHDGVFPGNSPPAREARPGVGYSPDGSPLKSDSAFIPPPAYSGGGSSKDAKSSSAGGWVARALFSDSDNGEAQLKERYEVGFSECM